MALQDSTGTTRQVLEEFSVSNGFKNISKRDGPRRHAVCSILGINKQTGREWFDKFTLPTGVNLIKLQVFLELMGYTMTERAHANKLARRIGDCLALGDITPKSFGTRVNISENAVLSWTTTQTPTNAKMAQVEDLLQEAEPQIEAARKAWMDLLEPLNLMQAPKLRVARAVQATNGTNGAGLAHQVLKTMENLLVDLRKLASPTCSPAERVIFLRSDITVKLTEAVDTLNFTALKDQ